MIDRRSVAKRCRCLEKLKLNTGARAPEPALRLSIFNGEEAHDGFGLNSTLVFGAHDAVLMDARFTLANAHRLVAKSFNRAILAEVVHQP